MKKLFAAAAAVLVVAGFAGALVTGTVKSQLVQGDYYKGTLTGANVYERLYGDLAADPQFAPQLDKLLGGINVRREDAVAMLKQVARPEFLKAMVDAAIDRLVAFLDDRADLDLSLDVTPILSGIYDVAIKYGGDAIAAVPVTQSASAEEFVEQFKAILGALGGDGTLPTSIPSFPLPEDVRPEVAAILYASAGLSPDNPEDGQMIGAIDQALTADDVAVAIKITAAVLLDKLARASILALTEHPLIRRLEQAGVVKFMLGPPPRVTRKLESKLGPIKDVDAAAVWLLPVSVMALLTGLVILIALLHKDRKQMWKWLGGALAAAGLVGFVGWAIAKSAVTARVNGGVIQKTALPKSLKTILSDTVDSATGDLTLYFWGPSIALLVIGAVMIVISVRAKRPAYAA